MYAVEFSPLKFSKLKLSRKKIM